MRKGCLGWSIENWPGGFGSIDGSKDEGVIVRALTESAGVKMFAVVVG